jgi:hypothetical protein
VLQSLDDVQAEVQMSVRGERRSTNSLRPSAKRGGLRLADVFFGVFRGAQLLVSFFRNKERKTLRVDFRQHLQFDEIYSSFT